MALLIRIFTFVKSFLYFMSCREFVFRRTVEVFFGQLEAPPLELELIIIYIGRGEERKYYFCFVLKLKILRFYCLCGSGSVIEGKKGCISECGFECCTCAVRYPQSADHCLAAGGEYPDGSASRAMWRYDPVLNTWHEMAPMNVCRYHLLNRFRYKCFSLGQCFSSGLHVHEGNNHLKGHGNEADFPRFLHKSARHRSLTLHFEPFRFWLGIRGDIRNQKTTLRLIESGRRRLSHSASWGVVDSPTRLLNV
jgi:hypothetical protein